MEFDEVLEIGGSLWDNYVKEFDFEVRDSDWVLISHGNSPITERVITVFNQDSFELGETANEAVARWGVEARDTFDFLLVEDFLEEAEEESWEQRLDERDEDLEAQFWEDEAWRDDL